jgi:hypothetical protein
MQITFIDEDVNVTSVTYYRFIDLRNPMLYGITTDYSLGNFGVIKCFGNSS